MICRQRCSTDGIWTGVAVRVSVGKGVAVGDDVALGAGVSDGTGDDMDVMTVVKVGTSCRGDAGVQPPVTSNARAKVNPNR